MKYRKIENFTFNDLETLAIQTKDAIFNPKNEGRKVMELRQEIMKDNGLDPNDKEALVFLSGFWMAYWHIRMIIGKKDNFNQE